MWWQFHEARADCLHDGTVPPSWHVRRFAIVASVAWFATALGSDAAAQVAAKARRTGLQRVGLALNPLGLALGRYSMESQIVLAPHVGFIVNPFLAMNGHAIALWADPGLKGFGYEVGPRLYSAPDGPGGFFFGATGCALSIEAASPESRYVAYGFAIDVGTQWFSAGGALFGIGIGGQYLRTGQSEIATPRVLFMVGWAP